MCLCGVVWKCFDVLLLYATVMASSRSWGGVKQKARARSCTYVLGLSCVWCQRGDSPGPSSHSRARCLRRGIASGGGKRSTNFLYWVGRVSIEVGDVSSCLEVHDSRFVGDISSRFHFSCDSLLILEYSCRGTSEETFCAVWPEQTLGAQRNMSVE